MLYVLHFHQQACRGKVDAWIAPYIQLALTRLARTEKRALRDALVCVVANALYYNPALGLSVLQSTGALASFFGTWMGMVQAAKSSGKPQHFRRMHDKKVREHFVCVCPIAAHHADHLSRAMFKD